VSATPAIHFLRAQKVPFTEHPYRYEEHGGTAVSSRELGVDEHSVIKTLVMEDESKLPLVVLMHGDRDVSTKNLARQIGKKTVTPCAPDVAQKHSGYLVGGTSPFGTRKPMPVYMERTGRQRLQIAVMKRAARRHPRLRRPLPANLQHRLRRFHRRKLETRKRLRQRDQLRASPRAHTKNPRPLRQLRKQDPDQQMQRILQRRQPGKPLIIRRSMLLVEKRGWLTHLVTSP
jgi:Cys-tRNA(Pro) deacylase